MATNNININGLSVPSHQNFLIVEDELDINEMIVDFLEIIGFNGVFYQALNLQEAKKVLSQSKIHYILCDLNLPDGTGLSLLKAIRNSPKFKNIPFLMITGNDDVNSMITSSNLGASEYLVKPFTMDDLQTKLSDGWLSHEIKNEDYIAKLEKRIKELEEEVAELKSKN